MTIYKAIKKYIDIKRSVLSPSTLKDYLCMLDCHFATQFGQIKLSDLTNYFADKAAIPFQPLIKFSDISQQWIQIFPIQISKTLVQKKSRKKACRLSMSFRLKICYTDTNGEKGGSQSEKSQIRRNSYDIFLFT